MIEMIILAPIAVLFVATFLGLFIIGVNIFTS